MYFDKNHRLKIDPEITENTAGTSIRGELMEDTVCNKAGEEEKKETEDQNYIWPCEKKKKYDVDPTNNHKK